MNAVAITNLIRVNILVVIDGEAIAEVDCADYDAYRKLPDAIQVQGYIVGKSGWSSDRNFACYKENILLGQIVDVRA